DLLDILSQGPDANTQPMFHVEHSFGAWPDTRVETENVPRGTAAAAQFGRRFKIGHSSPTTKKCPVQRADFHCGSFFVSGVALCGARSKPIPSQAFAPHHVPLPR